MKPSSGGTTSLNRRSATESYALTTRNLKSVNDYDLDDDINPESDSSLLRKHFDHSGEDHDPEPNTVAPSGILQNFLFIMSRAPLLLR